MTADTRRIDPEPGASLLSASNRERIAALAAQLAHDRRRTGDAEDERPAVVVFAGGELRLRSHAAIALAELMGSGQFRYPSFRAESGSSRPARAPAPNLATP